MCKRIYPEPTSLEVQSSHKRIAPYINYTSLRSSAELNDLLACEVFFKCENEQKIGAFKARGAVNAVLQLSKEKLANGLVTHSSGNHAQALAFAGNIRQAKTWVVMPETAPKLKIEKVRELGAEIIFCQNTPEDRQAAADAIVKEHGATFIHPFDNHHVIMGQATVAKEILEEEEGMEYIISPVGGGGLLSGSGLSSQFFSRKCKVFGAEPEGAADAIHSFATGNVEHASYVSTIADGLHTHLSERTLQIIRKTVKDIWLVSEDEIKKAMQFVYKYLALIIEPSAAVSVAALLKNVELFRGKKVAVILTGGNIDLKLAQEYIKS